jgi:hypothetical protein
VVPASKCASSETSERFTGSAHGVRAISVAASEYKISKKEGARGIRPCDSMVRSFNLKFEPLSTMIEHSRRQERLIGGGRRPSR